ncbi:vascular endothelial growth factor D [Lingula anatina]|uniref:Vascular endothelial growth factor D n=1 Tax=Lingula anatina TaxID=7574 RepID=A0A1S3HP19_LINAN|nr:vascular endothelial growth factor D [Lingula anatina]|eukprot:XP_013387286.1 vascular endothelial growth factor D [Lingula anatina]
MSWVAYFVCVFAVLHGSLADPPASFLLKADRFRDPDDFIREFVDTGSISSQQMEEINSAIRDMREQGRRPNRYTVASTNTLNDGCIPEQTAVALNEGSDPNVLTFPVCVKVSRCGGCCGSETTTCGPSPGGTVTVSKRVMKFEGTAYNLNNLKYIGAETKLIEEHTACQCQCKVKAGDCNPAVHIYDQDNCRCKCKVPQISCSSGMVWDDSTCRCISKDTVALLTWRARTTGEAAPSFSAQPQQAERVVASDPCDGCTCGRRWNPTPGAGNTCECVHSSGRSRRPCPARG